MVSCPIPDFGTFLCEFIYYEILDSILFYKFSYGFLVEPFWTVVNFDLAKTEIYLVYNVINS